MLTTFWDRLQRVIDDRKPYAWARSIGWNKGTTSKVTSGHTPGPELLVPICWAENARLDWLLAGRGTPYIVAVFPDDITAMRSIEYHLQDSPDWHMHLLASDVGFAVCLSMPAEIDLKGETVKYTALEVFVGALGERTRELIYRQHFVGRSTSVTPISADTWFQLQLGEIGTYQLLHKKDAILSEKLPLPPISDDPESQVFDWNQLKVAEEKADYLVAHHIQPAGSRTAPADNLIVLSPETHRLIENIEHLAPADREVIEKLLSRLTTS